MKKLVLFWFFFLNIHPALSAKRYYREMAQVASSIAMTTAVHRRIARERRKLPGRGCTWSLSSAWFSWSAKSSVRRYVFLHFLSVSMETDVSSVCNTWWSAVKIFISHLLFLSLFLLFFSYLHLLSLPPTSPLFHMSSTSLFFLFAPFSFLHTIIHTFEHS